MVRPRDQGININEKIVTYRGTQNQAWSHGEARGSVKRERKQKAIRGHGLYCGFLQVGTGKAA